MHRVLVTGGAGFIGSYVVEQLLERGCEVLSFDCLLRQVHPDTPNWPSYQPDHERLSKWFGDVRDLPRAVKPALKEFKPDTIIHLAAAVGVGQSAYQPGHYTSTNVTGTAWLLDAILSYNREEAELEASIAELDREDDIDLQEGETQEQAVARVREELAPMRAELEGRRHGYVRQVFVAGSMSSYGEGEYDEGRLPAPIPTPEGRELRPSSIYAWTKAEQERLALWLGRIHGLDVRVGRFFNTYGSRQALSNPYTGVGAIFSARVAAGAPPVVFEDGAQTRDFIHASDVASAVLAILDRGQPGEVYNVGTGIPTSIAQLARMIAEPAGLEPIITGIAREGDIRHCYADSTKLRALGWEPKVSLADGLVELREWVTSQPVESAELLDRATQELVKYGLVRDERPVQAAE